MALTIAPAAAVVAAAMLLFITREGWDRTSPFVKSTFITATAIAAFYGPFPSLFKQDENATENSNLYVAYINVEQEILSFLATGSIQSKNSMTIKDFIHQVDKRLVELNKVAIGFDKTQVTNPKTMFEIP